MSNDTRPSTELLLRLLGQAEAFIKGFEGDETQEGVHALLTEIRAVTGEAPAKPAYAVVQEGGSSVEIYLHVSDTLADAEAFRLDCTNDGGYRTSGVIEVPAAVASLGEAVYAFTQDVLQASLDFDYA